MISFRLAENLLYDISYVNEPAFEKTAHFRVYGYVMHTNIQCVVRYGTKFVWNNEINGVYK